MADRHDILADRLNAEPAIFKGCSSSELGVIVGVAALVWLPVSLILAGLAGAVTMGFGIAGIGIVATVLLLDEMMEGLNPSEVARAMSLVKEIRDRGVTVIMIEHVMRAIMSICDRIIVLHHGAKIAEGTPEEISAKRKVIEVYFGERSDARNT